MSSDKKFFQSIEPYYKGQPKARYMSYTMSKNDLSNYDNQNLRWFGRSPPPENLTLWDKRRCNLDIECDCGCVSNEVDACYTDWYTNPGTLEQKIASKNKGACDIIQKHFHYIQDYTSEALKVLVEFMIFSQKRKEENLNISQSDFLAERYNLTYDETMVILENVNKMKWFEHGSGARYSWMTPEGKEWLQTQLAKISIPRHFL